MNHKQNLFTTLTETVSNSKTTNTEIFDTILSKSVNGQLEIKRIVSTGQCTPENEWYDQEDDEWVILLRGEATIVFENWTTDSVTLSEGDYLDIPAHIKHRVAKTSQEPPCVWLAVHHTIKN
jgi:cupin 2 domain-containing protein